MLVELIASLVFDEVVELSIAVVDGAVDSVVVDYRIKN